MAKLKSGTDFEAKPRKRVASVFVRGGLMAAAILGAVFTFCSIFYIWLYIQQVQNGYRLAKLQEEYEKSLAVQRKLRLEWYRLRDPYQLEDIGMKQFGLAPPRPDQKLLMR
ncbi:MAG: hypothetical protein ACLGPL_04190 [Acidobacteriota bacterium]